MKITDIDYYAQFGESRLNCMPAGIKLLAVVFVVATVVLSSNLLVLAVMYAALLIVIAVSAVPKWNIIKISLFPLIFLALFLLSISNISLTTAFIFVLKALNASTAFAILVFTTGYTKIFSVLNAILPDFVVNILFMTYRSVFILAKTFENLIDMLHFRGMPSTHKPLAMLEAIGNLVGFFVIKSMQTGENMYEAMKLRGYSGSFAYLKGNDGKNCRN